MGGRRPESRIPVTSLQQHAIGGSTQEFKTGTSVCIDFPAGRDAREINLGDPVRVRIQKYLTLVPILGIGTVTIRGRRHSASSGSRTMAPTRRPTTDGADWRRRRDRARDEHQAASQRRARRHPRSVGLHGRAVPRSDGPRRRRRQLVHAQAPASEQGGRRRPRGGIRVPVAAQELHGISRRPRRPRSARSQSSMPGTGTPAFAGNKYNQTVNATKQPDRPINASSPTDADWTDGASPCTEHPTGDAYSPADSTLDRRQGPRDERRDAVRRIRPQPALGVRAGSGRTEAADGAPSRRTAVRP